MHKARIFRGRTSLSFFAQVRLVSFQSFVNWRFVLPLDILSKRARPSYYLSVWNRIKDRLVVPFLSESGCKDRASLDSDQIFWRLFSKKNLHSRELVHLYGHRQPVIIAIGRAASLLLYTITKECLSLQRIKRTIRRPQASVYMNKVWLDYWGKRFTFCSC